MDLKAFKIFTAAAAGKQAVQSSATFNEITPVSFSCCHDNLHPQVLGADVNITDNIQ